MLKEIHWEPQSHCLRSEKLTVHPDELCCCQRPLVALLELLSLCARLWTPPHDRQGSYQQQQQQRRRHGGGRDGSLSAVTTPEVGWLHFHFYFYLFRVNLSTLTSSAIYSMDVHMYCGLFWHANNLGRWSFARTWNGRTRRHLLILFPLSKIKKIK